MFNIAVSADDAAAVDLELRGIVLQGIEKDAAEILKAVLEEPAELSVYICSAAEIQQLNRQYRGKDSVTDVLAFSQVEQADADSPRLDNSLLGDVVICLDVLVEQAGEYGHSVIQELHRLLIHGILHLIGYDHEQGHGHEQAMKQEEQRILRIMGHSIAE